MANTATTSRGNRATTPKEASGPGRKDPEAARSSRLGASDLRRVAANWLADGESQSWSPRTLTDRRQAVERFCWWLENTVEEAPTLTSLNAPNVRAYLSYARQGSGTGRYGSEHPGATRQARPSTIATYYRVLRALVNWCVEEGLLEESPLRNVRQPRVPVEQVQPFEPNQVQALVDGARRGRAPERDVAVIFLLVDSGMRVSELCGLLIGHVDRGTGELTVLGKGNKRRRVYMGSSARRALWRYLEAERRNAAADEPLFCSIGGNDAGGPLTPSGVRQIIKKAGEVAGITGVRVSPHTLRHTFAVSFLRSGGNVFELQQLLGHTDLTVSRRYVALAEADLAQAHRAASPADRMRLK